MFTSTQEAVAFGLQASDKEKIMLSDLRTMYIVNFDSALDRGLFDEASVYATKAQFCREALQAKSIVADHRDLFKDLV